MDVPDTPGLSKNNIGQPSGGPKIIAFLSYIPAWRELVQLTIIAYCSDYLYIAIALHIASEQLLILNDVLS